MVQNLHGTHNAPGTCSSTALSAAGTNIQLCESYGGHVTKVASCSSQILGPYQPLGPCLNAGVASKFVHSFAGTGAKSDATNKAGTKTSLARAPSRLIFFSKQQPNHHGNRRQQRRRHRCSRPSRLRGGALRGDQPPARIRPPDRPVLLPRTGYAGKLSWRLSSVAGRSDCIFWRQMRQARYLLAIELGVDTGNIV